MGLFGKSFEEKVDAALAEVEGLGLGARNLGAKIEGKIVTLTGECPSLEAKTKIMNEFNSRVETGNTLNLIRIVAPHVAAPAPAPAPVKVEAAPVPPAEQWYTVVAGDTLSGIAKKFYGKASLYMKIFEANRDILDNPDKIKVGQKLRIPS
jgi:LysM repeat protein